MPSVSRKQHRFMEAVAHNRDFAKKVGVPQSVGKEFASADEGKPRRGAANSPLSARPRASPTPREPLHTALPLRLRRR